VVFDAEGGAGPYGGTSPTVLGVYERVLQQVHVGERKAGSIIRDADLAAEFRMSRTPVREALQILRAIGVLEVVPSRYTRIAVLGPHDVIHAGRVVLTLHELVVREVVHRGEPSLIPQLEAAQAAARAAIGDPYRFFRHCFRLHGLLVQSSHNPHLVRAIEAAVPALRLGVISNIELICVEDLLAGQDGIIEGIRRSDANVAEAGLGRLWGIGDRLLAPAA